PHFDNEPDMDNDNTASARDLRQATDVLDDPLLTCMGGSAGIRERPAIHDHVVLQVLNDHRATQRIQAQITLCELGSWRGGIANGATASAAHIGFMARPDLGWDRINRMRRGQIEGPKIRTSPSEIGDELGKAHFAEQVAACRVDPDTTGRGDPDIAALITF